jgi:hypothetical protein
MVPIDASWVISGEDRWIPPPNCLSLVLYSRLTNGLAAQMLRSAFTVRTGNNHHITVRIAEPNLLVPGRWVDVRLLDDLGPQFACSLNHRVKVVYLEPQQDTVSRPHSICIDEIGVVFLLPSVQLKQQPTRAVNPIV